MLCSALTKLIFPILRVFIHDALEYTPYDILLLNNNNYIMCSDDFYLSYSRVSNCYYYYYYSLKFNTCSLTSYKRLIAKKKKNY